MKEKEYVYSKITYLNNMIGQQEDMYAGFEQNGRNIEFEETKQKISSFEDDYQDMNSAIKKNNNEIIVKNN